MESRKGETILGLGFEDLWHIPNGEDSFVIPIPTLRPTNIVFKGDAPFSFGHYGVHLGQEDRLVFIGPQANQITAYFLDCRKDSETFGVKIEVEFSPSSQRAVIIPPGVAHTFDTRAITTLNLYRMFLPPAEDWLSGKTQWTVAGDIVNVPQDVLDEEIPKLSANTQLASEMFYELIAQQQRTDIADLRHEYPFTTDFALENGDKAEVKLWKRLSKRQIPPEWEPIDGIEGAGWRGNLVVWTGERSGYVPMLDRRPRHLIDHGETVEYTHDAFGIHIGGDDHLTFIGPLSLNAKVELVDCREGSPTLHQSASFEFSPNPLRTLIIPRGVAHRFSHMEGIFTINQPLTFLPKDDSDYQPGNDVIDWPIDRRPFPILRTNSIPADTAYYSALVNAQREMTATPPSHSTPSILRAKDKDGREISIAIRESLKAK